jgi:hypothetical protein
MRFHGGQVHWAEEFGLRYRSRRKLQWTKARVERQLSALIGQRQYFPSRMEFLAAGESNLYNAVCRTGGMDYWADRMGLPLRAGWRDRAD